MHIRRADARDVPRVLELAESLGLDYRGMERDVFFVAEENGRIRGIVGLKRHREGLELCALGVEPTAQGRGIGRALVEALSASVSEEMFLGTVIPGFFEKCGFRAVTDIPDFIAEKRASGWCDGCPVDRCTVMVRRVR